VRDEDGNILIYSARRHATIEPASIGVLVSAGVRQHRRLPQRSSSTDSSCPRHVSFAFDRA
jgi:hypothetical protein